MARVTSLTGVLTPWFMIHTSDYYAIEGRKLELDFRNFVETPSPDVGYEVTDFGMPIEIWLILSGDLPISKSSKAAIAYQDKVVSSVACGPEAETEIANSVWVPYHYVRFSMHLQAGFTIAAADLIRFKINNPTMGGSPYEPAADMHLSLGPGTRAGTSDMVRLMPNWYDIYYYNSQAAAIATQSGWLHSYTDLTGG